MKKLMHIMFLSCLKATELIEKRFDIELSITDKIRLKLHLSMCKACTDYNQQSSLIHTAMIKSIDDFTVFKTKELPKETKEYIKKLIKQK